MKDFYIFKSGRLKRKDSTVLFIDSEGNKRSLPIEQIANLHVFGEVDFNSRFFRLMNQHQIFVHMYNYYGYYAGSYIPRNKQVSGYIDIQQASYYLDHTKRIYLAKSFLKSAVHHIVRQLKRKKDLTEETIKYINLEKNNLLVANKIDELMGVEGRIRRAYYQSFNHLLSPNPTFQFTKREKRPAKDPLNSLISFGNSLCYTTILSEIYKTTLNPTISFLHQPSQKRFSLCLDLAEIFKPLMIDSVIFSVINNRMINEKHFQWIDEMCFLNEKGKQIFISEYEKKLQTTIKHRKLNRKVSYRNFIRLECYKLIKHFIGDEVYKPLKAWW